MTLGARGGTVTSDLLRYWHVQEALTTPHMHPEYQPRLYIFATLSSTWLMCSLLHQTKRVNISSGGYIMSYTCSQ